MFAFDNVIVPVFINIKTGHLIKACVKNAFFFKQQRWECCKRILSINPIQNSNKPVFQKLPKETRKRRLYDKSKLKNEK